VIETAVGQARETRAEPGTVIRCERDEIWVATGQGVLELHRAQLEGKKPLTARELVNGRAIAAGDLLE
jgi:methionyl-tRNA formyltransferase